MKPFEHAKSSAKKYGGKWEDYIAIHDFFDQSKSNLPTILHRAALHHSFGIFLCQQVFGPTVTNSDGKLIPTRSIGEDHVLEDLGQIPTLEDWLHYIPMEAAQSMNLNTTHTLNKETFTPPEPTPQEHVLDMPFYPQPTGNHRKGGGRSDRVMD